MQKPYAESCDQNRDVILEVLSNAFSDRQHVLEIGSGTGQHAVYFGRHLPHLIWQPSDLASTQEGMKLWINEAALPNVRPPLEIDVSATEWPVENIDAIFSANAVHIMSWVHVEKMFSGIGSILPSGGKLCLYGPFNYKQMYTSESNARFDQWLKSRDPNSGIRDFEALDKLAKNIGMSLVEDFKMPQNNRILLWQKQI